MRRFRNITLKATACIMAVGLIVSAFTFNIDSWWPTVLCLVTSLWLGIFCYANMEELR